MDLLTLKTAYLAKRTQFVLINEEGFVIDSCETLIQLKELEVPLFEIFPVLDQLRPTRSQLTTEDREIVYPVVEHSQGKQQFIFDFVFSSILHNGVACLLWVINDQTEMYMNIMQLRNRIQKHKREDGRVELRVVR